MNTCRTCRQTFRTEPFRIPLTESTFCSITCTPPGTLDEAYSLTYASLLEHYIDLTNDWIVFKDFGERDEYLSKIEYLVEQCAEFVLGEKGIHFFKDELARLHGKFETIQESVINHFLDVENYDYIEGLHISWSLMSKEIALGLASTLQSILDEQNWQPSINYSQLLDATSEDLNIITFPHDYNSNKINRLYDAGMVFLLNEKYALNDEIDKVFFPIQMARCPICTWPEPFEDFDINGEFQAYVCSSCIDKKRRQFL